MKPLISPSGKGYIHQTLKDCTEIEQSWGSVQQLMHACWTLSISLSHYFSLSPKNAVI